MIDSQEEAEDGQTTQQVFIFNYQTFPRLHLSPVSVLHQDKEQVEIEDIKP